MAVHRSEEALNCCLQSIHRQKVPDYQIIIGGVNRPTTDSITYLFRTEWLKGASMPLSEIQNEFCKRALKDFVVLMDANIELDSEWFANIRTMDGFDLIGSQMLDVNHTRVVDWFYPYSFYGEKLTLPLDYNEWVPTACISSSLMVIRRSLWEDIEFDENLLGEEENIDFCLRALDFGYKIAACPKARAILHHGKDATHEPKYKNFDAHLKFMDKTNTLRLNAQHAFEHRDYQKAIDLYPELLNGLPGDFESWSRLGWSYYFMHHFKEAIKAFDHGLKLNSNWHDALRGRGWAYYQTQNYNAAIADFDKALENLTPDNPQHLMQETLRGRAWAYYQTNLFDKAILNFTHALEYTDKEAKGVSQEIFRGRGWSFLKSLDFHAASRDFNSAIETIDPDDKILLKDASEGLNLATQACEADTSPALNFVRPEVPTLPTNPRETHPTNVSFEDKQGGVRKWAASVKNCLKRILK